VSAGLFATQSRRNLTDNASMSVGTGGAIPVPSLRGLALRPPYARADPWLGSALRSVRSASW